MYDPPLILSNHQLPVLGLVPSTSTLTCTQHQYNFDDLVDFAELAHNNITQRQCVTRAYLILNRSGRFVEAIKAWNRRLPAQQNWINFKTYFCQAHNEFRETTNLTLEQAAMEQRNALLVQQIMEGVQSALPEPTLPTNTVELTSEVANVASVVNQQSQVIPQLTHSHECIRVIKLQ